MIRKYAFLCGTILAALAALPADATNFGKLAFQAAAPTRNAANRMVDCPLEAPGTTDANEFFYQWVISRNYKADQVLARIRPSFPPSTPPMMRATCPRHD